MINKVLENPFPQEDRYFRVTKVYDNYLECVLLDDYTTKADGVILRGDEDESSTIYVVKYRGNCVEDSMCRLDWDTKTFKVGATNADKVYTYVDEFSRTAGSDTEYISPAYLNSKIRCRFNPCGTGIVKTGFGLIYWEEAHPRLWAGGVASNIVPVVTVTSFGGALYSVLIYANGFNAPLTGTGYAEFSMVNYVITLPSGTRALAKLCANPITGGGPYVG